MDCHSNGTGGSGKDGGLVGLKFVKTPGPGSGQPFNLEMHCAGQHAEHGPVVHRSSGWRLGVCRGQGQLTHRGLLRCAEVYAIQGQR